VQAKSSAAVYELWDDYNHDRPHEAIAWNRPRATAEGLPTLSSFLGDDIADVVDGLLVEPGSRPLDREIRE